MEEGLGLAVHRVDGVEEVEPDLREAPAVGADALLPGVDPAAPLDGDDLRTPSGDPQQAQLEHGGARGGGQRRHLVRRGGGGMRLHHGLPGPPAAPARGQPRLPGDGAARDGLRGAHVSSSGSSGSGSSAPGSSPGSGASVGGWPAAGAPAPLGSPPRR